MATKIAIINVEEHDSIQSVIISCLFCMEMCPQQAIGTKSRGFFGLFHEY